MTDSAAAEPPPAGQAIRLEAENPEPQCLPTLGVWQRGGDTLVSATFPGVPDLICDSWCYESAMDLVGAEVLERGRLRLRHRLRGQPHVVVATTVTPEPGAVEFLARAELDPGQNPDAVLPDSLPTPNVCWQLKRAPGFSRGTEPYPEFVKRCFIFTDTGRTFLDQTTRRKIPVRPAADTRNNPPWVQVYVGVWQRIPESRPTAWSDSSPDRYTATVIGAVSRDGRYLAALANDSASSMCQAWHDCMHNNPRWLPAEAPPAERYWRLKIFAMENDPDALLARAAKDFPRLLELQATRVPPE